MNEVDLWFELIFPLTGLALVANIVLLIITLAQKKIRAGGVVFVVLFAIGAPILAATIGFFVESDEGLKSIETYLLGVLYGYVIGQWVPLFFLIYTIGFKRKATNVSSSNQSKANVKDNTLDTPEEEEII